MTETDTGEPLPGAEPYKRLIVHLRSFLSRHSAGASTQELEMVSSLIKKLEAHGVKPVGRVRVRKRAALAPVNEAAE